MSLLFVLLLALPAAAPADTASAVRWTRAAIDFWDAAFDERQRGEDVALPAPLALTTALALAQHDAAPDPAAISAASAAVLAGLFPDRSDRIRARLSRELAGLGPDTLGAARGRVAGVARLAVAEGIREASPVPLLEGPGLWEPAPGTTPAGIEIPSYPLLVLPRAEVFRSPPPPALGSAAMEASLDSVRHAVRVRTAAQRRAARRWANRSAFLAWAEIAADLLAKHGASEAEAARTLAVLYVSLYDATAACFEAKYHYNVPRPSHLDPGIERPFLVSLPNFPAYPAGHGCSAGVAETVLAWALPEEEAFVRAEAFEMAESRLWAGVHYPFDNREGVRLGREVARYVIAHSARLAARVDG
ncbi:MAG: phosphatase PAP2 family protein [Bacteroidota bacterium]